MLISSPISAFFALLGSTVSTLTAIGLGASTKTLYAGLWAYSAVLTSIAIGGMFFVMNRRSTFFYTVLAAIITCIIHGATSSFLTPFGLPALTFPFNFVSWIFSLAGT
jgi:urea transporter